MVFPKGIASLFFFVQQKMSGRCDQKKDGVTSQLIAAKTEGNALSGRDCNTFMLFPTDFVQAVQNKESSSEDAKNGCIASIKFWWIIYSVGNVITTFVAKSYREGSFSAVRNILSFVASSCIR